jgi:hypothetical protein
MSDEQPPWEPPLAGSDADQILGSIERMRATFRWKADGLDAAGLAHRIGSSHLTLGSLLKHLAMAEDHYFTNLFAGQGYPDVWRELGHDGTADWEFRTAGDDSPEVLYDLYDGSVERSRTAIAEVLARGGMDQRIDVGHPEWQPSLRAVLCGLIEEYARHCGHADLIREDLDGRVGEDPAEGWRAPFHQRD